MGKEWGEMDRWDRAALDRHITGNYGEDFFDERQEPASPASVEFGGVWYVLQTHTYTLKEYGAGTGPVHWLQVGDVLSLAEDEEADRPQGQYLIASIRTYEFGDDMVDQSRTTAELFGEDGTRWELPLERVSRFLQKKEAVDGNAC